MLRLLTKDELLNLMAGLPPSVMAMDEEQTITTLATTVIEQQAEIELLRERNERLHDAAKQVETWWLEDGRQGRLGAPFCIFAIRSALETQ